jgi:hypothetical protein
MSLRTNIAEQWRCGLVEAAVKSANSSGSFQATNTARSFGTTETGLAQEASCAVEACTLAKVT